MLKLDKSREQEDQATLRNISKANTDLDNRVMYINSILKIMIEECLE